MKKMHIAVGTKYDFGDSLRDTIKNRTSTTWPIPKPAIPGDEVHFLIPSRYGKICARGIVKNKPTPSANWKGKYEAEVGNIVRLSKPVPIQTIAEMIPEWLYLTNAKNYTTVPSDFAKAFLDSLGKTNVAKPAKKKIESILLVACDITDPPNEQRRSSTELFRIRRKPKT